ncbi:hemolysin-III related-domain-containing protein [Peziza echinospora]|nr:hemolysin-III related-domain-containing protein [Peziza echinospora]
MATPAARKRATAEKDSKSPHTLTESVEEVIEDTKNTIQRALTCVWDELPSWQQDNHYIRSGYRHASNSFLKSIHSLTYLHNESINVYTHLIGTLLLLLLSYILSTSLPALYATSTTRDLLAFTSFFLGGVLCLGISAAYHLTSNHSPRVAQLGNRLDHIGIVFMIAGSYISSFIYGFPCHPHLLQFYILLILALGLFCIVLTLHPRFRTPQFRPVRAGMYVLYGLSGIISIFHGIEISSLEVVRRQIGLEFLVLEGVFYIVGAGIYAARVPERWCPGRFDLVGSSHQIFHTLVVVAAVTHLWSLVGAFGFWHGEVGARC